MSRSRRFLFLRRISKNLFFLAFLNGFLLASLFYFKMQSSYEDSLFASIKTSIDHRIDRDDNRDSIVLKAMDVCHSLMSNRASTFEGGNLSDNRTEFFRSVSVDLMTTSGACGSYALVLSRVLEDYNFPVRIAQMYANGVYGGHNIVEVNTGSYWVVLDPTFNFAFTRPDFRLASFADVEHNWGYYSRQVPPGYNSSYRYEAVRYTNWTKIPLIMPSIKYLISLYLGPEKTNTLSIRIWFLRVWTIYSWIALLLLIPVILSIFKSLVRTRVFPNQDTPFTINNLFKYARVYFRDSRQDSPYIP
jgi:hypothetical protein